MNMLDSVEEIKGIGPKTAEVLEKAGIRTLRDFFYNLPRGYENYRAATSIADIRPGKVVVRGKIDSLASRRAKRRNLSITEGVVHDATGAVKVVWFNQSYRLRQFSPEKEYFFTGPYELKNGRFQLTSPAAALVADIDTSGGLTPIYVSHGKIKSSDYHRLMEKSRSLFAEIPDLLPGITPGERREALFAVHFPESPNEADRARQYLAYEELFALILAAKLNRRENNKLKAPKIAFEADKIRAVVKKLPFELTKAQRLAAWEIFQDMERDRPMNRLLQGDVGSGKTIVAGLAAYEAILQGRQVAILAPTAILATQHYASLGRLLANFGVKTVLLTGATKDKAKLKRQIISHEVDLIVGTHALLTDDTNFADLSLVIIDEQHRFGVGQRQKLALKSPAGIAPHLLAMTATPIPRSLQLTVFGDLDVSILGELPKGRKPITTEVLSETESQQKLYPAIRETIAAGHQVYWICKMIDDGRTTDTSGVTSVKTRAKKLQQIFPDLRIEFLHGKMKQKEKDAIMSAFAAGDIDILVSTTVVEVGVDVPNASLMVVENAESYGLAQLHQLRGRVGRGEAASWCYLVTSGDDRPSRRLLELEKSSDGFHLAEVDLELRGPGEIYGSLQHGALDLRFATLTDTKLVHKAQVAVDEFLQNDGNMLKYKELSGIIAKYQQLTTLN